MQVGTPFDIYEHPKTTFISTFLGKTNSLPATLVENGDGGSLIECNGVRLKGPKASLPTGPIEIALRPERIEMVAESDAMISGMVVERVFQGNQWLFRVETPLAALLVVRRNTGRSEVSPGEAVHLAWSEAHLHLLPAGQGAAR